MSACLAVLLALAACASTAPAAGEDAFMYPKCRTVWVTTTDIDEQYLVTYSEEPHMTCPDCHAAIVNSLKTGSMTHACDTCGTGVQHCKRHPQ